MRTFDLRPGARVYVPRGVTHAYWFLAESLLLDLGTEAFDPLDCETDPILREGGELVKDLTLRTLREGGELVKDPTVADQAQPTGAAHPGPRPVILLVGGPGTRLRRVFDGPKCLAPVNGVPFLGYLLSDLLRVRVLGQTENIWVSTGREDQQVRDYVRLWGPCVSVYRDEVGAKSEILGLLSVLRQSEGLGMWSRVGSMVVNGDTFVHLVNPGGTFQRMVNRAPKDGASAVLLCDRVGEHVGISYLPPELLYSLLDNPDVGQGNISSLPHVVEPLESPEEWYIDIGTPEGLARAQELLSGFPGLPEATPW